MADFLNERGEMNLLLFFLLFPFASALLLLLVRNDGVRNVVVKAAAVLISTASICLLLMHYSSEARFFAAHSELVNRSMFYIEILLSGYIIYLGIRFKRPWILILTALQLIIIVPFEALYDPASHAQHNLFVDKFSIIMGLIVGVLGSLIAVYALGYMKTLHEQSREKLDDERPYFFFIIFTFISAMYGIVFSNNLVWLYFFWEITTLCSFILIGYKKDDVSRRNAFHALELNLLGGVAFAVALVYLFLAKKTIEMDGMLALGKAAVILPVILIGFAGLTKSAQLPFSSWLLGAMVAPTPVSALLHSSTMVKAGVYVIVRMSPLLQGTTPGLFLALVGGLTFMFASFIAITQSDAKRVLAYSTVGNLGLIVLCGGVGSYEAVWAAVLLIVFHAVAKGLLFVCVGTIEHQTGSRDIEDMTGLIVNMPRMAVMMLVGMAGMFIAPFGMLISKWLVLKALVDYNPLLTVLVVWGGAATIMFWVKWMGKLIMAVGFSDHTEKGISLNEWVPFSVLTLLTAGVTALFPILSNRLIEPYIAELYAQRIMIGHGNVLIMSIMLSLVMLFPLSLLKYRKRVVVMDAYVSGINIQAGSRSYNGIIGESKKMEMKNYYLRNILDEGKLSLAGNLISIVLTLIMFGVVFL
jgi:ech hydrogenase subunit A